MFDVQPSLIAQAADAATTFFFDHERVLLWLGLTYFLYGAAEVAVMLLEKREGAISRWWTRTARILMVLFILTIGALHCEEFQERQLHLAAASTPPLHRVHPEPLKPPRRFFS